MLYADAEDEETIEDDEWENQQIRKAVTGAQVFILNDFHHLANFICSLAL